MISLPQALRLARCQASATLLENVNDLQSENDTINQRLSCEEERLLKSNAEIVVALEDLFSRSEKDPTSRTSKLSRVESVRFQRAIYRIWLMSELFGPRRFASRTDLANKSVNHKAELDKTWMHQKTILEQFTSQELIQIRSLADFLMLIVDWAITAEGGGMKSTGRAWELSLLAGPRAILRCYEDETSTHLQTACISDDGPYTPFLKHAYDKIVQERQLTEPSARYVRAILDDLYFMHDKCRHCGRDDERAMSLLLPALWNETNWDDLKGRIVREEVLAGNLLFNLEEKQPLMQALGGDWSKLLHEMLVCGCDEYEHWSKGDWICIYCWVSFFRDTLWRWRLVQKRKAGGPTEMNCRYGYDCKKQCGERGSAHAKQFNHLCEPADETPEHSDEEHEDEDNAKINVNAFTSTGEELCLRIKRSDMQHIAEEAWKNGGTGTMLLVRERDGRCNATLMSLKVGDDGPIPNWLEKDEPSECSDGSTE